MRLSSTRRCFRCLAPDHRVAECCEPVRCFRCRKYGHRATSCKEEALTASARMNRAHRHRGRIMRVYVLYTEEYLGRRKLRRNAVLADVIHRANLGTNPQRTIATAMARRFGSVANTEDFGVARYRDRDFAIFLSEWISAEVLTRREVLTLDGFWIRSYAWGQYKNARHTE